MSSPLPEGLLNRPLLRQLAGDKGFAHGEEYFTKGRVRALHVAGDRVTARVNGSRAYRVKLWRGRGELEYSCNCSVGREEVFCKHCVAVGLAWLAGPDGQPLEPGERDERRGRKAGVEKDLVREQLQRHLRTVDKERLVALLLESTDYDDILRRRLLLEIIGVGRADSSRRIASPAAPATPDFAAYREILREAIECTGYVDYDAMPEYAQGIEEAIYPLGDLLRAGYAPAVIDLAEYALIELDKANEMVDGGDGSLNAVYDDLQHYHLEACRADPPDPEKLAVRLLEYELEGGLGVFNNAIKAYAEVLGPPGVAAWRRRLVREWSRLPALVQAVQDKRATTRAPIDHRRFQLQTLMERLAETEGDLDTVAAVRQRDLSSAHDYLALAELYQGDGRFDEALSWAERGLQAFPELPDRVGLREFVANAYHREGRHEDAVRLIWDEFKASGGPEHFRKLRVHAEQAGTDAWPRWRERALTHLRAEPAGDASVLVEILLAEDDADQAWTEARARGCRPELWLRLAERRERQHPADALEIYQQRLEPTIARGGQHAFREAAELLSHIYRLFKRLDRVAEFGPYRDEVRAAHRQKRQFLKLLDAASHGQ